ncbi:transglycosylase family protein [Amycolatopsis sp. NPDC059090]|uniref:transglycosylase family protein n=1 Tax=Amycolatopsis sp. NPDC059090 TaxID=3346723 RepID=UPI0036734E09
MRQACLLGVAADVAHAEHGLDWDAVAACERGQNWSGDAGNDCYGGLQFTPRYLGRSRQRAHNESPPIRDCSTSPRQLEARLSHFCLGRQHLMTQTAACRRRPLVASTIGWSANWMPAPAS